MLTLRKVVLLKSVENVRRGAQNEGPIFSTLSSRYLSSVPRVICLIILPMRHTAVALFANVMKWLVLNLDMQSCVSRVKSRGLGTHPWGTLVFRVTVPTFTVCQCGKMPTEAENIGSKS